MAIRTKEEAIENIKEAIEVYLDIDDAEIETEVKGKKPKLLRSFSEVLLLKLPVGGEDYQSSAQSRF